MVNAGNPGPGGGIYAGVAVSAEQIQAIASGRSRGLSGNAIINELRGTPLAIRRQAAFPVIREIDGSRGGAASLQQTPMGFAPSEGVFYPTPRALTETHRIYGYVDAIETITGETRRLLGVINFSGQMSRSAINSLFAETFSAALTSFQLTYASYDIQYTSLLREGTGGLIQ